MYASYCQREAVVAAATATGCTFEWTMAAAAACFALLNIVIE